MILSATLSKPAPQVESLLGAKYKRIKIKLITASRAPSLPVAGGTVGLAAAAGVAVGGYQYAVELFTEKQAFHKKFTEEECGRFLETHAGHSFRSCVERTEREEITILANKHGKITRLVKALVQDSAQAPAPALTTQVTAAPVTEAAATSLAATSGGAGSESGTGGQAWPLQLGVRPAASVLLQDGKGLNRKKQYLLPEGIAVPFLVYLGVMTADGRVISQKYDKFRQINRFLEYIADVLPSVLSLRERAGRPVSEGEPLRLVDFGSGKSYLTFAVHYFLTEKCHIPCMITGLDLKEDVIAYCSRLAGQLACGKSLQFAVGDIASYGEQSRPDIVITLHACDTATDYALEYALSHGALAILSVPCCQHEVNAQLDKAGKAADSLFAPLLRYGILKERFAALVTDALRAEYVERSGYRVQMLEFIDMSHTPKNLLLRAVRKEGALGADLKGGASRLEEALGITPCLKRLLASR